MNLARLHALGVISGCHIIATRPPKTAESPRRARLRQRVTAQTLRSFLESPARGEGTLKYHELQGFLFAVACAPDIVAPLHSALR
jgi:hypothetical protein